jgi:hypothetical protein
VLTDTINIGAQFEFTLAAIAQNLRRLAKLVARPPPIVQTHRRGVSLASASLPLLARADEVIE